MKNTYTIPEIERENVMKLIARYQNKAESYGQKLIAECGDPYLTQISVYHNSRELNGVCYSKKAGAMMVEAFDLTIESEVIRKEGYELVAKIEHLDGGNIVYNLSDDCHEEWHHMEASCQHCGRSHGQKITFIVRNADGEYVQVGSSCLKDYCGIDPQRVGLIHQLTDMVVDLDCDHYDFDPERISAVAAYDVVYVLAVAMKVYRENGYRSSKNGGGNKEAAARLVDDCISISDEDRKVAEILADNIMKVTLPMAHKYLLDNVQMMIRNKYCKRTHFGYIAYAPVAYEKYSEVLEKNNAERDASAYVGEIGQRITIDVSDMKLLSKWANDYGFTYLYKITDSAGNIMVWYASKTIEKSDRIRATIKAHSEYNGVKQTVITRCSVVK